MILPIILCTAAVSAQPENSRERQLLDRRADLLEELRTIESQLGPQHAEGNRPETNRRGNRRGTEPDAPRQPINASEQRHLLQQLREADAPLAEDAADTLGPVLSGMEGERFGRHAFPRIRELLELRKHDQEAFEVKRAELTAGFAIMRAARDVHRTIKEDAPAQDIDASKQVLLEAVRAGFYAKRAVALHDVARLRADLQDAEARIENANTDEDRLIDEHFSRIIQRIERRASESDERKPASPQSRRPSRGSGDD